MEYSGKMYWNSSKKCSWLRCKLINNIPIAIGINPKSQTIKPEFGICCFNLGFALINLYFCLPFFFFGMTILISCHPEVRRYGEVPPVGGRKGRFADNHIESKLVVR